MVFKFFDIESSGGAAALARLEILATRIRSAIKNENISEQQLPEELYKPIIRKFEKRSTRTFSR